MTAPVDGTGAWKEADRVLRHHIGGKVLDPDARRAILEDLAEAHFKAVRAAVEGMRERCAKVADRHGSGYETSNDFIAGMVKGARGVAKAIRSLPVDTQEDT